MSFRQIDFLMLISIYLYILILSTYAFEIILCNEFYSTVYKVLYRYKKYNVICN